MNHSLKMLFFLFIIVQMINCEINNGKSAVQIYDHGKFLSQIENIHVIEIDNYHQSILFDSVAINAFNSIQDLGSHPNYSLKVNFQNRSLEVYILSPLCAILPPKNVNRVFYDPKHRSIIEDGWLNICPAIINTEAESHCNPQPWQKSESKETCSFICWENDYRIAFDHPFGIPLSKATPNPTTP